MIEQVLTRERLRRLAGGLSFERGLEYVRDGRVGELQGDGDELVTTVAGERHYRVRLWADGGELAYSCTCPVGVDGLLCKHVVAVGLAWLGRGRPVEAATRRATIAELGEYLARLTSDDLLELVIEHAAADDAFRERLLKEAGRRRRH